MAKDPADRYQSAEELVAALDASPSRPAADRGRAFAVPDGRVVDADTSSRPAGDRGRGRHAAPCARSRNPIDRLTRDAAQLARHVDWLVTIVGAILIVLAIKQWVINPYRIPSSSMEPTLHCARPGNGARRRISDRVLACRFCYHSGSPKRGDIIVFNTPRRRRASAARAACSSSG